MQKLSRREALRGTGVAALAAGAAVVPFVAKSQAATLTDADPELVRLGAAVIAMLPKYKRLRKASETARVKMMAFLEAEGVGEYMTGRIWQNPLTDRWQVSASRLLMKVDQCEWEPSYSYQLKATSQEEAESEVRGAFLPHKNRPYGKARERALAATGRDEAYERWNAMSDRLERDTLALSKCKASSPSGLRMKAQVIRAMEKAFPGEHGAYDEIMAFEPLRQSLVGDLLAEEVRS